MLLPFSTWCLLSTELQALQGVVLELTPKPLRLANLKELHLETRLKNLPKCSLEHDWIGITSVFFPLTVRDCSK